MIIDSVLLWNCLQGEDWKFKFKASQADCAILTILSAPHAGSTSDEMAAETNLTYEEAFAQMEMILGRLEAGDLPLEESLALYEQGAALAKLCASMLDEAELRVRQWQPGDETVEIEDWEE